MANSTIAPHPRELESVAPSLPLAGKRVHMLGICGTAMAALAGLLKSMGASVTGSDQNVYPPMSTVLANLGIPVISGFRAENIPHDADWAIVGNVISRSNPEAQALLNSKIPFCSLPQAMGSLAIAGRHSVIVSGTHGKTTTTAMNAWIADQLGLKPGFMVGGVAKNFPNSFNEAKGDYFIIEGDEYDTAFFDKGPKFLHYRPKTVVINAIEFDHADIYRDLEHVKSSFIRLLEKVPNDGLIVANAHEDSVLDVIERSGALSRSVRLVLFSDQSRPLSPLQDRPHFRSVKLYSFTNLKATPTGLEFDILSSSDAPSVQAHAAKISMLGQYNAMNALSAFAVWTELGFSSAHVLAALAQFKGVKRRQEILGRPRGITVIEDFAHHPTAVQNTLRSLKSHFPNAKIHAVFEFRSATARRDIFTEEYLEAFQQAHAAYFPPAFNQDSIPEAQRFSVENFAIRLNAAKPGLASVHKDVTQIIDAIEQKATSGDVVVIMSNGGFDGIYTKLMNRLDHQASRDSTIQS